MKKRTKKSSFKKGKSTRGDRVLSLNEIRRKSRKGWTQEMLQVRRNYINMRNQKSQTNHPIPVTSILSRNNWIVKIIHSARMM